MYGIIYNPVSGKKQGKMIAERIANYLNCPVHLYETRCAGDGVYQASQAIVDGCDHIVGIGGDGSLGEIVSTIAGKNVRFFLVPCGTGNDFMRVLNLPSDPFEAFCAQLSGTDTDIDCINVNGKAFLNVSGSGFDVDVLRKTESLKDIYPEGKAYRKAVLSVIASYKPFEAELTLEDGVKKNIRATICEFANGRYFGGGMCVAPDADIQDGLIDVVLVKPVPSFAIPFLLPLFISGWHTKLPISSVVRVKKAVLAHQGMVLNIDGRLERIDRAAYQIMPGALHVRLPQAKQKA